MQIKKTTLLARIALFYTACLLVGPAYARPTSTGILNIQSLPDGATVFINGTNKGTTPLLLEVPAQTHEILVRHKGYEDFSIRVPIKKDRVHRTNATLKKKTEATNTANIANVKNIQIHQPGRSDKPGTVFLNSAPSGLTAYIDGFEIPRETPVAFDIVPGIYKLELRNSNDEIVYRKTIFVKSDTTVDLDIVIHKKRTIDYTDPWR